MWQVSARQYRLMQPMAIPTHQDSGVPPGLEASDYTVCATDSVLPNDIDWKEALLPKMHSVGA